MFALKGGDFTVGHYELVDTVEGLVPLFNLSEKVVRDELVEILLAVFIETSVSAATREAVRGVRSVRAAARRHVRSPRVIDARSSSRSVSLAIPVYDRYGTYIQRAGDIVDYLNSARKSRPLGRA